VCACRCSSWLLFGLQSIEHLRWDNSKVRSVFSYDTLPPSAADWLGQQQVEEVKNRVDVR
jgi:hypothetical protein